MQSIALYLHIPFCETKCPYCDFNTYAKIESLIPAYVSALRNEIAAWGQILDHPDVKTIFFGGGTPSYLPPPELVSVVETIRTSFRVDPTAEVTLEANPGDFDRAKLATYLDCGFNRISIGVQSLDDTLLSTLGRRHTVDDAISAFQMASDAGFKNVSIDLMYGLPYQTIEQWETTLKGALDLGPPHISMYALTLEGGTPMERWVTNGQLPEPDSDLAADMYIEAQRIFDRSGYAHYEISNWAIPGFESHHNLVYWQNESYLGVGPGAHSYLQHHRFSNLKPPREYVQKLKEPLVVHRAENKAALGLMPVVAEIEHIDTGLEMAETMILGLRLDQGINVKKFASRFDNSPFCVYENIISDGIQKGLLEATEEAIALTNKGRLLSNEVFSQFF